jgi:hypothetical protein
VHAINSFWKNTWSEFKFHRGVLSGRTLLEGVCIQVDLVCLQVRKTDGIDRHMEKNHSSQGCGRRQIRLEHSILFLIFFYFLLCWMGDTLWQSQKFFYCIKYIVNKMNTWVTLPFCYSHNKLLQTKWLKTTQIHFL